MGDIRKRIVARRVVVGDTPTLISDNLHYKNTILIKNLSGTRLRQSEQVTVYLDGYDTATPTTGYPFFPCDVITLGFQEHAPQIPTYEFIELWGVCSAGEQTEIAILEEEYR